MFELLSNQISQSCELADQNGFSQGLKDHDPKIKHYRKFSRLLQKASSTEN